MRRVHLPSGRLALLCLGCLALGACQAVKPPEPVAKPLAQNPDQTLQIADIDRQAGDYGNAIRLYKRLIDAGDNSYHVRVSYAESLAGVNAMTDAIEQYGKAVALAPNRPEAKLGLGRVDIVMHRPAQALVEFDAALAASPGLPAALNGRGVALDLLERHQEAQQAYEAALAQTPSDKVLRNNYGLSLVLAGDYARAVATLSQLVEEPGATPRNRQNLALALGMAGRTGDAESIALQDLDERAVENNLAFYDQARRTAPPPSVAALPAPPTAPAGPTAAPQPAPTPVPPQAAPPATPTPPAQP